MDFQPITIPELFRRTVAEKGPRTALRVKKLGLWQAISWDEYYRQARLVGQALLASGLQKGDFVAIIGENAPEWVIIDMGILLAGGVSVGIYSTSSWKQVRYIVNHSQSVFLFAENEEQVDKYLHMREETPQMKKVIYWEEKGLHELDDPRIVPYASFLALSEGPEAQDPGRLDAVTATVKPEDLAILVYTSGTTGPPKGAMLSHANLTWMGFATTQIDPGFTVRDTDEVMSFLPLCHIFERLFSVYIHLTMGYTVNFVESTDTVPQNLREISPTLGYAVPRIWEKMHSTVVIRMDDAKPIKRLTYRLAIKVGMAYAELLLRGERPGPFLRLAYFLAHWSVFYFIKKRLGMERMRLAFSGAAPIAPEVLKFFNALGLRMIEGYGQTESSGISTAIPVRDFKLGYVGKVIPGGELRIAEDGEILVRTPGVFMGYYRNPEATAQALQEGWLHSGDIGELDADGYLRIVDRKKDLIITAGGKNIAPQYIENKLKFSPFINDAIVIGDRRKYLTAIIVLDEDNINKWARDHRIQYSTYADLAEHPDVNQLIDAEVQKVNKQLARVEQVRKFIILAKRLYEEDGEVTPTMKVKRKFINETYHDLIESMY